MVCDVEPAVAVIVTAEVPAGVPVLCPVLDEPELPPHPAKPTTARVSSTREASTRNRIAGFNSAAANFVAAENMATSRNTVTTISEGGFGHRSPLVGEMIAVPADVVIVSVVDAGAPLGVTVAGLNEQDASCGNPEHVKLVVAANPPDGVSVIVDVAELPWVTVAVAGLAASVKSPDDWCPTVTVTAVDVEDANVPSPA